MGIDADATWYLCEPPDDEPEADADEQAFDDEDDYDRGEPFYTSLHDKNFAVSNFNFKDYQ